MHSQTSPTKFSTSLRTTSRTKTNNKGATQHQQHSYAIIIGNDTTKMANTQRFFIRATHGKDITSMLHVQFHIGYGTGEVF